MKLVVLDGYTLNPGDLSWNAFEQLAQTTVHDRTDAGRIFERAAGAELVLTNKTPLSAETISQLPQLKYIGVLATGYNIVDVQTARQRGITVTNIPTYGTASVAQMVFALLLELCHNVGAHNAAVRKGEWSRNPDWCFWLTPLIELSGRVMGIVGFGRIGRQVARIAEALGMEVIFFDSFPPASLEGLKAKLVDLGELFRRSDVVSLHCPLTPENQGLISKKQIAAMKPTAFLINTSRGPLVVDKDLADALNAGRLAGAGLDVLSVEPPPADNPLLSAKNCIITPHIAWATKEARSRLMDQGVQNLKAFLEGKELNVIR